MSRLASLTNDLTGTASDLSVTFAYNPASQIASTVRTGDAYAWTGHFNENKTGIANGLNQLTQVGPKALTHDTKGNVTAFGSRTFGYTSENLLTAGPNATTLSYDPAMRLTQTVSGASTAKFAYDGLDRIAEYDGASTLLRRYVHGPADDEPIVWYEGSGATDRRFLSADERGSIVSVTDSSGALLGINRYDEYGQPQSSNLGAFGYTGQAWLPTIGAYYYKARVYDPELGRFLQPDPIGTDGGINLYAYVGNDPVNWIDPLGLAATIIVTGCPRGTIYLRGLGPDIVCVPAADPGSSGGTIAENPGGGGGGGGGGGNKPPPQNPKPCPTATKVELNAVLYVYGGAAAFGVISGTLSDPKSGRSESFSTQIGVGGGFGLGRFDVRGQVPAFNSLDRGFGIAFATAGYKALGGTVAELHTLGGANQSIGQIEVTPFILSPPVGAADIGFKNGVTRTPETAGTC